MDSFVALGVVFALVAFCITVVLPIASFIRALGNDRALRALTDRVRSLEDELRALRSAPVAAPPSAAPAGSPPAISHAPAASLVGVPIAGPDTSASAERAQPLTPDVPEAASVPAPQPVVRLAQPSAAPDSLEARIGMRWMLYVGTATLVLGLAFFVKYAFDHAWITETLRVTLGTVAGLGLVAIGRLFVTRGFALYGQVLEGGGFAVIYLSIYAALNFYALVSAPMAFMLLFAVSVATAWEADRQRSLGLALGAVVGGFLAPFTIGSAPGGQVGLFGYVALLIALAVGLSRRHGWPELNVVAYGLTVVTVLNWIGVSYQPSEYLVTEIFLTVFCALFLFARRSIPGDDSRSRAASSLLLTAPVFYHAASIFLLIDHSIPFLVYLIVVSLAGIACTVPRQRDVARLLVYGAVAWPFFGWLATNTGPSWVLPGAATLVAIYTMHLIAQIERRSRGQSAMSVADVVLLHLNGLGLFAGGYLLIERVMPGRADLLAALLALLNVGLARGLASSPAKAAPHFLALGFGLAATAIGLAFDGAWVAIGWAAQGAGVAWLGLSSSRHWMRQGGVALLMLGVARLLTGDFFATSAGFMPILNVRAASTALILALLYGLAWLEARRPHAPGPRTELAGLIAVASLLSVVWLTAEVSSYWREHGGTPGSRLAADLSLSIVWALYAIALTLAGIRQRYAPVRYLALVLFAVTLLKLFLFDLSQLAGVYRIAGFMVVGVILLIASLVYQKFRARLSPE